jgi:PHIKZ082
MELNTTTEMTNSPNADIHGGLKGRECKFVTHVMGNEQYGIPDMHYVKEVWHYNDGTMIRNLRPIRNYKRSFWVTKENYRNHKQKKETEEIGKLNVYTATQTELPKVIASRLGDQYRGCNQMRILTNSPYLYGTDVKASDEIMYKYVKKNQNITSPNIVCALDIETNTLTDEIILISVCLEDRIYTTILESFLPFTKGVEDKLEKLARASFPDEELAKNVQLVYDVCKTEKEVIERAFLTVHKWQPDFLAIWNIAFDIPTIETRYLALGGTMADLISDPRIKPEYRFYKYNRGAFQKVTASGKVKPIAPHEQWITVQAPASFFLIDAMQAYNFVRSGQKQNPGGYSLNAIIEANLGEKFKKLHFDDPNTRNLAGLDWHQYMVDKKPLEYVIYNQWDTMAMILLDNEIQDLKIKIRTLSGIADFGIFNSGPKKIVTNMFYFNIERGQVMGCKPPVIEEDEDLPGLDSWIVMLDIDQIHPAEVCYLDVSDSTMADEMVKRFVFDADCVSSYPSDTLAANVSKDTTAREILSVEGITEEVMRLSNINLMFGKVNQVTYMSNMCNYPTLEELEKNI